LHREIYQNHLGYFVVVFDDTLGQSLVVSNNFIDFLLVEIFEFLHNRGDAKDFKTGMQSYDFYQVKKSLVPTWQLEFLKWDQWN